MIKNYFQNYNVIIDSLIFLRTVFSLSGEDDVGSIQSKSNLVETEVSSKSILIVLRYLLTIGEISVWKVAKIILCMSLHCEDRRYSIPV